MKHLKKSISVVLLLTALLLTVGCGKTPPAETKSPEATNPEMRTTAAEPDTGNASGTDTVGNESETVPGTASERAYRTSGTLRSTTGTYLDLFVDWVAESPDGVHVTLTLTASLHCYSIDVGARPDMGRITLGDQTEKFSTPAFRQEKNEKTTFPVFTRTYELTAGTDFPVQSDGVGSLPVRVVWQFNGTYGKTPLGDVVAEGTLKLGN